MPSTANPDRPVDEQGAASSMTAVSPSPAVVALLRAAGCVFAEEEAELLAAAAGTPAELGALVDRRVAGLPLEQVLGWAEFCGLRIVVEPGVFVPRRRTAFLVQQAAALAPPAPVVVDLCCGTGAVGVALAARLDGVQLYAADVDPAAVRCARRNIPPAVGRVLEGDLDEPLPRTLLGRVDVLVANAPYVPTGAIATMPPEARDHEALLALDGGADGLDVQRRVAAAAPRWLRPGGVVLIETSERQALRTAAALTAAGLVARVERSEELDGTVAVGTRPAANQGRCCSLRRRDAVRFPGQR
jgi:release factor glutamine methyltransferase